jgi:hypothetical protein
MPFDTALMTSGFAGALRRGEIVGLRVEDPTETAGGLRVLMQDSKTDQEGREKGGAIARPLGTARSTRPCSTGTG